MQVRNYSFSFPTTSVDSSVQTRTSPKGSHLMNEPATDVLQLSFLGKRKEREEGPKAKAAEDPENEKPIKNRRLDSTKTNLNTSDIKEIQGIFKAHFGVEPKASDIVVEPYDETRSVFDTSPTESGKRAEKLTEKPLQPGESRVMWLYKTQPDEHDAHCIHGQGDMGESTIRNIPGASYKKFSDHHYRYSIVWDDGSIRQTEESIHPKGESYVLQKTTFAHNPQ